MSFTIGIISGLFVGFSIGFLFACFWIGAHRGQEAEHSSIDPRAGDS